MFVKNLIKPSDFVTLLPIGMPATLEYDELGALKKAYWGFADEREDVSDKIFGAAKITDDIKPFPFKIGLKGGTTWVEGIVYTPNAYTESYNILPEGLKDEFFNMFASDPSQFHFFAANVNSGAAPFVGPSNTRRWLDMQGFDVLPGFVASQNVSESAIIMNIEHLKYEFDDVMEYIIFRRGDVIYATTDLKQHKVVSVSKYLNPEDGTIHGKVTTVDKTDLDFDYSDIVTCDFQPNSMVVLDAYDRITRVYTTDDKVREKRPNKLTCSVCGAPITVTEYGPTQCSDPDCLSRSYPRVKQICETLGLYTIDPAAYLNAVKNKQIVSIIDVLDLPEYGVADEINCTLKQILCALLPKRLATHPDFVGKFVNQCNSNPETILFYIKNPDKIYTDLSLDATLSTILFDWVVVGDHAQIVESLIMHPKMRVVQSLKKFDGDPILRKYVIYPTGNFRHGPKAEIERILSSYSADVRECFDNDVNCIITGDTQESIDGQAVRMAKVRGIPVHTETEFFTRFQIDEDLAQYVK